MTQSNNSLEHCCRLPYLARQYGNHFDVLYELVPEVLPVQLILSFVPDERVPANHRVVMNNLNGNNRMICYRFKQNQNRFGWSFIPRQNALAGFRNWWPRERIQSTYMAVYHPDFTQFDDFILSRRAF